MCTVYIIKNYYWYFTKKKTISSYYYCTISSKKYRQDNNNIVSTRLGPQNNNTVVGIYYSVCQIQYIHHTWYSTSYDVQVRYTITDRHAFSNLFDSRFTWTFVTVKLPADTNIQAHTQHTHTRSYFISVLRYPVNLGLNVWDERRQQILTRTP